MMIRVFGILLSVLLLSITAFMGLFSNLILPFQPLGERIQLLAYTNYAAIAVAIPLLGGFTLILIHQLISPQKGIDEYAKAYRSIGIKLAWFTIVVAILSILARFYLGYKVDQAGYVKCVNESRTSAKSSWRVYAKSDSLCKGSSGIYGG
ncbi:DUF1240 domain-containing protein [Vibrio sp. MEBiC08052]|uniref:DUF1240 domain-containing protein n=1 Tax=Vibrio sp. MEBiC08052 TaxID=1761910 RepID=UPI0009EBFF6E|nr:DUF1240 domain-containing protein [Vibrio sp. MEBiC08052]